MMKKSILTLCLSGACMLGAIGQGLDNVWKKVEANDLDGAMVELENYKLTNPQNYDGELIKILLNSLEGRDERNLGIMKALVGKFENNSAYYHALWHSSALLDGHRKYEKERKVLIEELMESPDLEASLQGSALYALGMNEVLSYKKKNALQLFNRVGNVKNWSFVGAFDNVSGSGFDKDYKPVNISNFDTVFTSKGNAPVKWFVPSIPDEDPWVTFHNIIPEEQGIIYAQSFLNNPETKDVILTAGFSGSIKVWVNEKLVLQEEEERRTDYDYLKRVITLPAGINRVLVQMGFTHHTDYPNFSVRLLNTDNSLCSGITSSASPSAYNSSDKVILKEELPHFAESFFKDKIKKDSSDILNYILLAKCYMRSKKNNEAVEVLQLAEKVDEKNILVQYELLMSYKKVNDRTELMKQVENIRDINSETLFLLYYDYSLAIDREDYKEAEKLLSKIELKEGSASENVWQKKIELLGKQKDYEKMYKWINNGYYKFPESSYFAIMKYYLEKNKSSTGANPYQYLEKYLKKVYNYKIWDILRDELAEAGSSDKVLKMLLENHQMFPTELDRMDDIAIAYYQRRQFSMANNYCLKALSCAPYRSNTYSNLAYISIAQGQEEQAKSYFRTAIQYNPNAFEAREKLRDLDKNPPMMSFMENKDAKRLIEEALKQEKQTDDQYEYVFYQNNHIQYPEGASTIFTSLGIKILNKSGIDTWKEANIPTNYSRENLVIHKAVINKVNGQKHEAERNYNQLVFTNLEVGDVIFIEFRKDIYTGGKLAKEITLEHVFDEFVPVKNSFYKVYLPKDHKADFVSNLGFEPVKTEVDEFLCYTWTFDKIEKITDEPYMPMVSEIGKEICITSIKSWDVISNWYRDLAIPMAKEDYNLDKVYRQIFDNKNLSSDYQKAEAIYNYICENITYSSVSFRQSNFVPQKPMKTISTKLGDCKDVSTLFHTLAKKAGLETNLVLVNTRDNGEETMKIPSTGFNHCIIRIKIDDKYLFQELTDKHLPFGTLPNMIKNAQALVIPNSKSENVGKDLIHIPDFCLEENKLDREVVIKVQEDGKLNVSTKLLAYGSNASEYRYYFVDLTKEELEDNMKNYVSNYFKKDFKIESFDLKNLEERNEAFQLEANIMVEDEIKSIGSMQTFSLPFFEKIVALDNFPNKERKYPLNYWLYENVDVYKTVVSIEIPSNASFVEIPKDLEIKTDVLNYSLKIEKMGSHTIKVTRIVYPNSKTFAASEYNAFREDVKAILRAEDVYIAFKEAM